METPYEVVEAYYEKYDEAICDIWLKAKEANDTDRYPWKKLPLTRVKKIWRDYMKFGFVRDEKGIQEISDKVVDIIARLDAATALMGHTPECPKNIIEDKELDYDEATDNRLSTFLTDEDGGYRLSDFGLKPLQELSVKILTTTKPEELLLLIDRVLNVVHQRSDLASWFVEGGRGALEELSNQQ